MRIRSFSGKKRITGDGAERSFCPNARGPCDERPTSAARPARAAIPPIEALDLRRNSSRDPELSMTSSATKGWREATGCRSCARRRPTARCASGRVDLPCPGQSTTSTRDTRCAVRRARARGTTTTPWTARCAIASSSAPRSAMQQFRRAGTPPSNARRRSAARSSSPSAPTNDAPSDSTTAMARFAAAADRAMSSASRTSAPRAANCAATSDFPLPMPPVRPTRYCRVTETSP